MMLRTQETLDGEIIVDSFAGGGGASTGIELSPRELYNAMGFPPDYIIDHDADGKPYPKTQQVARCGNAVCPPMAAAVVAANLPEYAVPGKIETMAALADAVAM